MKRCPACTETLLLSEFRTRANGKPQSWCRRCTDASSRRWVEANPDRVHKNHQDWSQRNRALQSEKRRAYEASPTGSELKYLNKLRREHGISTEEYRKLLATQSGRCAICREVPRARLALDHNHSTGAVRALLCRKCNSALGLFHDDPVLLRIAADYLEQHRIPDRSSDAVMHLQMTG